MRGRERKRERERERESKSETEGEKEITGARLKLLRKEQWMCVFNEPLVHSTLEVCGQTNTVGGQRDAADQVTGRKTHCRSSPHSPQGASGRTQANSQRPCKSLTVTSHSTKKALCTLTQITNL